MLRNGETSELDEPELNDHGMPIIHDIAMILGCKRGSDDDFWSWPGKSSDLHEIGPKIDLAQPEFREDKQMALLEAHHFSSKSGRFSSPPQDSETPFAPVETNTANPLTQQDDWLLSWKHSMPEHQESQHKPAINLSDVLMRETQIDVSNSSFFPMDPLDSPHQIPQPENDMFDTRDTTNPLITDIRLEDIDWTMWSDIVPLENIYKFTHAVGLPNAMRF